MRRYVDTFLRFWPIVVLPIVILPAVVFDMSRSTPHTWYASMNVWVDDNSVKQLTYSNQYNSPAQNVASYLGQLLQIRSFDVDVAKHSPLYWRTLQVTGYPEVYAVADLPHNTQIAPVGDTLLAIQYANTNPTVGVQVVRELVSRADHLTQFLNRQAASTSLATLESQLGDARRRANDAVKRFNDYLAAHQISRNDVLAQQEYDPTLAALNQQWQSAQADVLNFSAQIDKLRLQQRQAGSPTATSIFRTFDAPAVSRASSRKKLVFDLVIALAVGLLLGGGFIVVKTALDRSIRYADEVRALVGLPVLATLPYSSLLASQQRHRPRMKVIRGRGRAA